MQIEEINQGTFLYFPSKRKVVIWLYCKISIKGDVIYHTNCRPILYGVWCGTLTTAIQNSLSVIIPSPSNVDFEFEAHARIFAQRVHYNILQLFWHGVQQQNVLSVFQRLGYCKSKSKHFQGKGNLIKKYIEYRTKICRLLEKMHRWPCQNCSIKA